jgi:hypothetical protein
MKNEKESCSSNVTFDEAVKIYIRFLKEHGAYKRAIEIHMHGEKERERETTFIASLKMCDSWHNWLQDDYCFCLWRFTKENEEFWWALSILWQIMCIYKNILSVKYINKKTLIQSCINSIDRYNGWFQIGGKNVGKSCVDEATIKELRYRIDKFKKELIKLK